MPFSPDDTCTICWCCMEVACRPEFGGCHAENADPDDDEIPLSEGDFKEPSREGAMSPQEERER